MIACPKVICTVPVYKSVEAVPYMTHLLFAAEVGKAEALGKYKVRWNVGGPGVRIAAVRNSAAMIAIRKQADYLLFIDDDMLVPPNILELLLEPDLPIVSPIFFRSGDDNAPLAYDIGPGGVGVRNMRDYPVDQLFEAPGGCGTGVMLIKREVLEAIEWPLFYYPPSPMSGMDLEFCRRAREKGFPTYCDSRILVEQMDNPQPVGAKQWQERKEANE